MKKQLSLVENYFVLNGVVKSTLDCSYIVPSKSKIIYEVLRVKNSTPIFLEQHLDRLYNSINILGLEQPKNNFISIMIAELLDINPISENNLRISLIYGSSKSPDLLIYFTPSTYPTETQRSNGVIVRTLYASRSNPNAKVENISLREKADKLMQESRCYEVLLVDSNGLISEGSRSNVFFIKDNSLFTPPIELVLGGITRQVVVNLAKSLRIQFKEDYISINKLAEFDGAFLTGTSPGVLPIAKIDAINFNVKSTTLMAFVDAYSKDVNSDISNYNKLKP
jgi:branched-chain amino acid aminotransferase